MGIDLRADWIKIAHLVKRGNRSIIKGLYQIENPIGKTVFKNQHEQEIIRETLAKIRQKLPSNGVIMGVSSNYAAFRYINFPLLSKKELREAIFWEMQEFDTIFNGEYISDYEILEKQSNTCRVLLVAAPKELIMSYTEILTGAGFYLKALDVYPLANARVLKANKCSGVSAIIDLDVAHSEITIVENGRLILNRNLDFPSSLSLDKFLQEISRIFNFYFLQRKRHPVEKIILLGGSSKLKGLFRNYFNIDTFLERELECEFLIENQKSSQKPMDFFSAIGFSLRG